MMRCALLLCAALCAAITDARDLSLHLNRIDPAVSPLAKCLDGTAPAYYFREGAGADASRVIVYLEGGGWCYPDDTAQASGANCAVRSKTPLGSSASYPPSIASTGYEGGSGLTSGDPAKTAFAGFAVAYVKYCDGGSMTGTRADPAPARNGSAPLYYRGHHNLVAVLDHLSSNASFTEVVLSGCSAGGMACYVKCDFVAAYFASKGARARCICDAGLFLDVETATGAGRVMQTRYHDIADAMQSRPGLPAACVAAEADWRQCLFGQYALKHAATPTFAINSLYNFGEWAMLAPPSPPGVFPPDTGTPPADWATCWPANGKLTPASYATCNATQRGLVQGFRAQFLDAVAGALDASSPHGAFLDSCPNQHCQTSTAWQSVVVNGTTMAAAAARWYFNGSGEVHVDAPFPGNPTCGYGKTSRSGSTSSSGDGAGAGAAPRCDNCHNAGLGSNCLWSADGAAGGGMGRFHGLLD